MVKKLLFTFYLLFFLSCEHPALPQKIEAYRWPVMGTFFEIKPIDSPIDHDVAEKIFSSVRLVDEKVSTYKSSSDLSMLNLNAGSQNWIKLDELTEDLLNRSKAYNSESFGVFNIAVGPLVRLWKMDLPLHGEARSVPDKTEIQKKLELVRRTQWKINNHQGLLSPKEAGLDMGGIAKGYALDRANMIAKKNKTSCILLNLGRQLMLTGSCSRSEKIAIQSPLEENKFVATIDLTEGSVSTSGAYERYFTNAGKTYGHLIDSKTGYPVQNHVASVTVWAQNATDADAWSTILYVLGYDRGMKMLGEYQKNLGVLWVLDDGKVLFKDAAFGKVDLEN